MAGPLGFFKGLAPRVLYSMPATAICWSTYEFFKFMLSKKSREEYQSTVTTQLNHNSNSNSNKSHPITKINQSQLNPSTNTTTVLLPKDVLAIDDSAANKLALRYVLPATSVSAADTNSNNNNNNSSSNNNNNNSTTADVPSSVRESSSILPRELPAMSGAGVYTALSLNTRHTETTAPLGGRRTYDRGIST